MGTFIKGTGSATGKCCGCGGRTPCDGPPASYLQCRTAEASITKCGFSEWPGYVSTPPRLYLRKTLSGIQTAESGGDDCTVCNSKVVYQWSGDIVITKASCPIADSDSTQVITSFYSYDCINLTYYTVNTPVPALGTGSSTFPDSYTSTVHTTTGVGCLGNGPGNFSANYYGSASETLSDEWTTSALEADVTAAIPAYSGPFDLVPCTGSYYDKTSDELTITKRKMEYKFVLPGFGGVSWLIGYSCYKIMWDEVFTPKGGGSTTVLTSRTYTWNGSDTETPVYEIDVPASEGTITVENITYSCTCS